MKIKKWQIILAATLALLIMIVTPVVTLAADSPTATNTTVPILSNGGLAIVAPHVNQVDQPTNIQVFARRTLQPVEGVTLWAVSRDDAPALRDQLKTLKQTVKQPTESDFESIIESSGFLMGKTDINGKLTYTYTSTGDFVMVAFKAQYWPDTCWITVRNIQGALGIQSPDRASPGAPVMINVFQKRTQTPVADASVYAVGRENIQALRDKIAGLKADNQLQSSDLDTVVQQFAAFSLGKTGSDGQLSYTFSETDRYLLITVKKGYVPAYKAIAIISPGETAPAATITTPGAD